MASNKTWLRHTQEEQSHGDQKTWEWEANGEPTPNFYANNKSDLDGGDARGRYAGASLAGGGGKNRNLSDNQF